MFWLPPAVRAGMGGEPAWALMTGVITLLTVIITVGCTGCILCLTLQKPLAFETQQKPPENERQLLRPAEELQPWAQLGEQQWQCECQGTVGTVAAVQSSAHPGPQHGQRIPPGHSSASGAHTGVTLCLTAGICFSLPPWPWQWMDGWIEILW